MEIRNDDVLLLNNLTRGLRRWLVVNARPDGTYEGFQGGHRYIACKQLGYKNISCKVLQNLTFKHL